MDEEFGDKVAVALSLMIAILLIDVTTLVGFLGVTSLGGLLTLYLTFLGLLPKLSIEGVVDRSKKFNSESRIKIKNIGKLSAWNIRHEANSLKVKVGGITVNDGTMSIYADLPGHLTGGESVETAIVGQFLGGGSVSIAELNYILVLRYEARFLFFRKQLSRRWRVELRTFEDGFSWNISLA